MVEFRISILFQYYMYILAKFNTFQGLENRFHNSILSMPRGNPVIGLSW